jgi:carbamoyltransferase
MRTYILGISCFVHTSSAALIIDGVVVAAAEEERFTGIKHDNSFPINAIEYCFKSQNVTIEDIDYIGFCEKPLISFERFLSQHFEMFPLSFRMFLRSIISWVTQRVRLTTIIKKRLGYDRDVLFIEHHVAHAASSFFLSPFQKAAIVTADGVGEGITTSFGFGEDNQITILKEIKFPNSLGLLYSAGTAYLGFRNNDEEHMVMNLSASGDMNPKTNPYYLKLRKVIDVKEDGSYRIDMSYFVFHYSERMPSKKLCKLLDGPVRKTGTPLTQRHRDIAAAFQMLLETVMVKILNHVHKVTQCDNVVLAGGVALNSVCNGKLLTKVPFKNIWIHPNAGNGGTSIGAASFIYHSILGNNRNYVLKNAYLGPEFSTGDIKHFLNGNKINYTQFKDEKELLKTTAKLIYENNVVGWFQGRMEWGPRALGARSILANPCDPDMKRTLNTKVKHQHEFSPFATVVSEEDALEYFECEEPISAATDFMLMDFPIKKEQQGKIPSATHVDGSGSVQTVGPTQNPLYYSLIKEFETLSGVPILINTPFNIKGDPIVCTPYDAYRCLMGTHIDYLIMDKLLIKREDNSQDMWSSEGLK